MGRGEDVRKEIGDLSLRYLTEFKKGYPGLFISAHMVDNPEKYLRNDLVRKQRKLVKAFDENTVRERKNFIPKVSTLANHAKRGRTTPRF
ncbi:hypothetical protein AKJ37_03650, partial [candidate division MSBL1 archaeon SCGC-AAA259I09]